MDREKVIKGLEICTNRPCYCTDCPYKANCILDSQAVMEDALALLKEQAQRIEALEIDRDILVQDINFNNCNTCKRQCGIRPKPGEVVRVNCYLWSEKEHA